MIHGSKLLLKTTSVQLLLCSLYPLLLSLTGVSSEMGFEMRTFGVDFDASLIRAFVDSSPVLIRLNLLHHRRFAFRRV